MRNVTERVRELHSPSNSELDYNWSGDQSKSAQDDEGEGESSDGFGLDDVKEYIKTFTDNNRWVVPGAIGGGSLGFLTGLGGDFNSPTDMVTSLLGRTATGAGLGGAAGYITPIIADKLWGGDTGDKDDEGRLGSEERLKRNSKDKQVIEEGVEEKDSLWSALDNLIEEQNIGNDELHRASAAIINSEKFTEAQKEKLLGLLAQRAGRLRISDLYSSSSKILRGGKAVGSKLLYPDYSDRGVPDISPRYWLAGGGADKLVGGALKYFLGDPDELPKTPYLNRKGEEAINAVRNESSIWGNAVSDIYNRAKRGDEYLRQWLPGTRNTLTLRDQD